MKKIVLVFVVCLVLGIAYLFACLIGLTGTASQSDSYTIGADDTQAQQLDNFFDIPKTITRQLDDGLVIDATVDIPDVASFQIAKYNALLFMPKEDKVYQDLFEAEQILQKMKNPAEDGTDNYHTYYLAASGNTLVSGSAIVNFNTGFGSRIFNAFHWEYGYNQFAKDTLYNADQFVKTASFDFQTIEAVYSQLYSFFSDWGIDLFPDYVCYCLDHETLSQQYEIFLRKNGSNTASNYNWTEDDDCYFFRFRQRIDGIPVTMLGHGNADDGSMISGNDIEVLYSKDGIQDLSCGFTYQIISNSRRVVDIISLDAAIAAAQAKYASVIITSEITISNVSFCYIPCKNGTQFDIVPAWVFETRQADPDDGQIYVNYVMIHAETGKEVL